MEGFFVIGERIKIVRKSNKMSQVEFAESLNVTKQAVSNWENNNVQPSADVIRTVALKYQVSADFLLELDDRLIIYCDRKLPIHIVTHIHNFIKDILVLIERAE